MKLADELLLVNLSPVEPRNTRNHRGIRAAVLPRRLGVTDRKIYDLSWARGSAGGAWLGFGLSGGGAVLVLVSRWSGSGSG